MPFDFARELFPENFDRFAPIMLGAAERLPILNEVGIRTLINGPIPVSADGEPIMGLAPELDNFYVACGFTAGIAASGGAGEAMAHWILDGDPGMDLWPFDVRRFSRHQANRHYLAERSSRPTATITRSTGRRRSCTSARGARRSPLYDTLKATRRGLRLEGRLGAADLVRHGRSTALETPSFEAKPGWFEAVGREHRAVRERGGAHRPDARSPSSRCRDAARSPPCSGSPRTISTAPTAACVYTQLCNERAASRPTSRSCGSPPTASTS